MFLSNIPLLIIGTLRQKRQVAQVSPNDVLLIGPPVMSNNELVIAFVVIGQSSDPINGSILATALEDGGSQLASALSIAVCYSKYYYKTMVAQKDHVLWCLTTAIQIGHFSLSISKSN